MSGRTPSFIVVGLVIIMFLLGLFYMSCSSKNTELRLSLEQFEERYRSLTLKHSDSEKENDKLTARKRELEEEKSNIQRQMEKKDSEINDLNTKLNEKIAELKSLQTDKQVLDKQLEDYKSLNETVASKNTLIEKLLSQLNEKKQIEEKFNQLKQDYDKLKNSPPTGSNSSSSNSFAIPPQRFRPLESNNYTTKSIASLFQDPADKSGNLTKEIKARAVPEPIDAKENVVNISELKSNSSTTTIINQQNLNNKEQNNQEVGQNAPAPPLANIDQQKLQAGHVESAQAAPKLAQLNAAVVDNSQYQNKLQRNFNNSLINFENDDEEELNFDNVQENQNHLQHNKQFDDTQGFIRSGKKSYRTNDHQPYRHYRKRFRTNQQHAMDHGGEIDAHEDDEYQPMRKRNIS